MQQQPCGSAQPLGVHCSHSEQDGPQVTDTPQLLVADSHGLEHALPLSVQPHWLAVPPPPQLAPIPVQGAVQQVMGWPQPSSTVPQFAPGGQAVVVGVQPQTFGTPAP